jgi:MFS family permease
MLIRLYANLVRALTFQNFCQLFLVLNLEFQNSTMLPIAFIGGLLSGIPGSNISAIILNVNTPDTRGRASALHSLLGDIGQGLGAPISGAMIASMGRAKAFNIISTFWGVSGLIFLIVVRTMAADEADVVEKVAARLRFGDHELDSVLVEEDSVHHQHVTVDARPVAARPLV